MTCRYRDGMKKEERSGSENEHILGRKCKLLNKILGVPREKTGGLVRNLMMRNRAPGERVINGWGEKYPT
jgi:hypothetical protein